MSFYNVTPEIHERIATIDPYVRHKDEDRKRNQGSVIYLDTVMKFLEEPIFQHARTFVESADERKKAEEEKKKAAPASGAPKMIDFIPERPYPFPCSFLYSPRELFLHRWAPGRGEKEENAATAKQLSNQFRSGNPPAELLATKKANSGASTVFDRKNFTHDAREMFPLDLYASPTAVAQVYTVLQGELGLAVYTPNEGVQPEKDHVYLFSPDATSCVVVACRVRLNPLIPVEEQQQPLLGKLQSTVAATMAHFDRPEDLSDRLHEMLYSTALPAWVHAVTEVYQQTAAEGDVLSYLRQRLPTAETPLLQVEWYVMGGVRMELSAAPVLEGIWKTFFPPSPKPKTKGEKVERPPSSLLKSEVSIADVMAHYEGEPTSLTMRHRLQEDGVCCWSFDTFMAPWRLDTQRISRRYANAACFGLLLQVSGVTPGDEEGGRCWPAEVAAGRRGYVMGTFRGMLIEDYRWLCPLEKDQSAVEQDGDHSLRLVRNTVQTEKVKSLVEKSASPFLSLSLLSGDGETVRLTLKEFVQRFLEAVRTNNTLLYSATSEGGKPNNNNQYMGSLSLLPLILRRKAAFVHSTGQEEDAPLEWWQRDFEEDLDAIPADTFLGFSTTPHCEPPDFPELMRSHFKMREATSSCDLFVPLTDGILLV